jgi:hypothetical protein
MGEVYPEPLPIGSGLTAMHQGQHLVLRRFHQFFTLAAAASAVAALTAQQPPLALGVDTSVWTARFGRRTTSTAS